MRVVLFVLIGTFVVVLLWVALANSQDMVNLRVGFGEPRVVPVAGIIVGGVFAGALFTGVLAIFEGIALRLENRRLRRRLGKLEEEVHDLRNMAFSDELPQATDPAVAQTPRNTAVVDET